jgi:hypothetical protein
VEKYCTARQATDDNIIRRMPFAYSITKATETHTQYVILIAFPRQQWLRERASMLRYTYIACFLFYFCCLKDHNLLKSNFKKNAGISAVKIDAILLGEKSAHKFDLMF